MIKGDYDNLVDMAKNNVCAEHKQDLEVAWYGPEKTYYLRCGVCDATDAVTRRLGAESEWRAGGPTPEEFVDQELAKTGKMAIDRGKQVTPFSIEGVPGHDLATGEVLGKEKMLALVGYARKYQLDPMRGHVCLMYGKPYITIDGYLYHAGRQNLPYKLSSRPLEETERSTYIVPEGAHAWVSEVVMGEGKQSFTGLGVVTRDEMTERSARRADQLRSPVVAAHPWQLAQKRAEWQALRRAFPIGDSEHQEGGA